MVKFKSAVMLRFISQNLIRDHIKMNCPIWILIRKNHQTGCNNKKVWKTLIIFLGHSWMDPECWFQVLERSYVTFSLTRRWPLSTGLPIFTNVFWKELWSLTSLIRFIWWIKGDNSILFFMIFFFKYRLMTLRLTSREMMMR